MTSFNTISLMKRFIKFLFLLTFITPFFLKPNLVYSTILFQDNFDNATESAKKWEVVGPQLYNGDGTPANWVFKDGKYGVVINNRGSQSNEVVPKDSFWNNSWRNYIFTVDFVIGEGPNPNYKPADTNLAFRLIDHTHWYGIHGINTEYRFVLQKAGESWSSGAPPDRWFAFEYNIPYRIKIIVEDDHIVVSTRNKITNDEITHWDIYDHGTSITYGKPALQASTGANPYCDVWFDNVLVTTLDEPEETPTPIPTETPTQTPTPTLTPTPTPPTPVVFLPGLGGSFNFKEMFLGVSDPDGWRMTPGANVYKNIQKAFEGSSDFFVFYYDWRKPVLENAQKLNDYIQNTVKPWNNKVDLIGHSLGGLVARTCVQKTANNCYVDKLITVGSPHYGAVDAYPALEGGEIWRSGPIKLGYELLVHYFQQPGETRRETIERIAPVLKDLLPTFDYLEKNGVNLSPEDLSFKNTLLPSLSDLSLLENITKTISGRGYNSVEKIVLSEANWVDKILGNWPDGKPEQKIYTLEGDTSVLIKSASFPNQNIENFTYTLDHGGIISEESPLKKILEILGRETNSVTYNGIKDEENFLVFLVHSPVKISSPDITQNSYNSDELIIIPDPQTKIYTLNVEGLSSGYYLLSVGQIFGEKVAWNDYLEETNSGKKQSFSFSINSSLLENPIVDPEGINTNNQLISQIKEFKKEIDDLKIKQKYKIPMNNLLDKIQNSTRKPEEAFFWVYSLRFTITEYENKKIINHEIANQFREKASRLATSLEYLSLLNPKNTSKFQAQSAIKEAEKTRNSIKEGELGKNGALVFLFGQEKLGQANEAFEKKQFYKAKVFAGEALHLFLESKKIK